MKKYILLITLFYFYATIYSQDVAISQKFFTSQNMRLTVDFGADISWAGDDGNTGLMKLKGSDILDEDIVFDKSPNTSLNIGFDIYSPNSTLGFYVGASFNSQKYVVNYSALNAKDSISNTNLEIPLYLKLRIGKANRKGHVWFALGGGYSIPTKINRTTLQHDVVLSQSDDKDLFNSIPFVSSIVGYEFLLTSGSSKKAMYDRDNFRILLYAKSNYDLGNRVNLNYKYLSQSSIGQFNDSDLRFLRISFGVKILMRLSKVKDSVYESLKNRQAYYH